MTPTDYDRVDYGGSEQTLAAPNLIAGISRLLGVASASPSRARVLELGCGNGAHLLPLAWYWPDAQFVGIDLAHSPIAQGRERARALGLQNLRLEQGDLSTLSADTYGQFDYVIAHGLFSWVPTAVREATLALIGRSLTPMGVAYVSYNAYPGCRIRHLTRELLTYHLASEPYSIATAHKARAVLESVIALPAQERPPFLEHIETEARSVLEFGANFLFHDDLSPHNQAFYLHEFASMAGAAGLSYLGDPELGRLFEPEGQPALSQWLDSMSGGDWLRRQQYLDFAIGTRFRRSLLCRTQDDVKPGLAVDALQTLRFFSSYQPDPGCNPADESVASFRNAAGRVVSSDAPVVKAILLMISHSPDHTIGVDDLARLAANAPLEQARVIAAQAFERLIRNGLIYPIAEAAPRAATSVDAGTGFAPLSGLTRFYLEHGLPVVDHLHRGRHLSASAIAEVLLQWDGSAVPALDPLLRTMARDGMLGERPASR